jgi:hypothetical protein
MVVRCIHTPPICNTSYHQHSRTCAHRRHQTVSDNVEPSCVFAFRIPNIATCIFFGESIGCHTPIKQLWHFRRLNQFATLVSPGGVSGTSRHVSGLGTCLATEGYMTECTEGALCSTRRNDPLPRSSKDRGWTDWGAMLRPCMRIARSIAFPSLTSSSPRTISSTMAKLRIGERLSKRTCVTTLTLDSEPRPLVRYSHLIVNRFANRIQHLRLAGEVQAGNP